MQGHSFPETGASATPQVASHAAAALASLDAMRHDLSVTHDALLALSNETEQLRHIVATNEGRSSGLQHELKRCASLTSKANPIRNCCKAKTRDWNN
jgi:hypothetical protein